MRVHGRFLFFLCQWLYRIPLSVLLFTLNAIGQENSTKEDNKVPPVVKINNIIHAQTAALLPKEAAVDDAYTIKLRALVQKIRNNEAPNGAGDIEKLKESGKSGCTWVKTGNLGGNKPSEDYQLFMAKMFVKHLCNPVSPVIIKPIPASPFDAFYPTHKNNKKKSEAENLKNNPGKFLHEAHYYNPNSGKGEMKIAPVEAGNMDMLPYVFSVLYTHGQRETSGTPTKTYNPTYKVSKGMGKNGKLYQWNIGQGLFHAASNTLNFSSTLNHPELTRIYSEYAVKIQDLVKKSQEISKSNESPNIKQQQESQIKQKFNQLCLSSYFEKSYEDSVTQNEFHNKIKSIKNPEDLRGQDIAWSSIKAHLTDACSSQAKSFISKVQKNITDAVEQIPEYARFLDKSQNYEKMVSEVEALRSQINTLEGELKSVEIDLNSSQRNVLKQKTFIKSLEAQKKKIEALYDNTRNKAKLNDEFFYNKNKLRNQHAQNLELIEEHIKKQRRELDSIYNVSLKNAEEDLVKIELEISKHSKLGESLFDPSESLARPYANRSQFEFEWKKKQKELDLQKEEQILFIKSFDQLITEKLDKLKNSEEAYESAKKSRDDHFKQEEANYLERVAIKNEYLKIQDQEKFLEQKLTEAKEDLSLFEEEFKSLEAKHKIALSSLEQVLRENASVTEFINNARRQAASMAFFSLDNTDYSLSEEGIIGNQEDTAKCFSALERYCPAMSVDYHTVNIRVNNIQFGPLSHSPKGFTPSCLNMFQEIYKDKDQYCKINEIAVANPKTPAHQTP